MMLSYLDGSAWPIFWSNVFRHWANDCNGKFIKQPSFSYCMFQEVNWLFFVSWSRIMSCWSRQTVVQCRIGLANPTLKHISDGWISSKFGRAMESNAKHLSRRNWQGMRSSFYGEGFLSYESDSPEFISKVFAIPPLDLRCPKAMNVLWLGSRFWPDTSNSQWFQLAAILVVHWHDLPPHKNH